MKITVADLEKKKACADQVAAFKKLFGESATVTLKNCQKASRAGLDLEWAVFFLLNKKASEIYWDADKETSNKPYDDELPKNLYKALKTMRRIK